MADDKRTISPEAVKKAMAAGGNPLSDYFVKPGRDALVDTVAGGISGVVGLGTNVLGWAMRAAPNPITKAVGYGILAIGSAYGTRGLMNAMDGVERMADSSRGRTMWEKTGLPAGPDAEKEAPGVLGPSGPQPAGDGAYLNDTAQQKAAAAPAPSTSPATVPAPAAQPGGDGMTAGYVATRRTASGSIQVQVGGYRTPGR